MWTVVVLGLVGFALTVAWRFHRDLGQAAARSARGSTLVATRCGPNEVQQAGVGLPLLVVHGSGGGHDQGMGFAGRWCSTGSG